MADFVLPAVKLIFPCDAAVINLADLKWELKNPWAVVRLPQGAKFPFRVVDLWVYAQLTDGVGSFDLRVEMRQRRDDGTQRTVGASVPTRIDFPGGHQLRAFDTAFQLKKVPFREAGLYEFYVTADGHGELQGRTAELRVLGTGGMGSS